MAFFLQDSDVSSPFRASKEEILLAPEEVYQRYAKELQQAYEAAWSTPGRAKRIDLPRDLVAGSSSPPGNLLRLPRKWGVEPECRRKPRLGARGVELFDYPVDVASRINGISDFVIGVENLVSYFYACLKHWFATTPSRYIWIVSYCGEPRINDLGSWLSMASWSIDEATEAVQLSSKAISGIPSFWSETAARAVKWEVASLKDIAVPPTYWPPKAILEKPFSLLPNPFIPLLEIWRSGAALDITFGAEAAAIIYINAKRFNTAS